MDKERMDGVRYLHLHRWSTATAIATATATASCQIHLRPDSWCAHSSLWLARSDQVSSAACPAILIVHIDRKAWAALQVPRPGWPPSCGRACLVSSPLPSRWLPLGFMRWVLALPSRLPSLLFVAQETTGRPEVLACQSEWECMTLISFLSTACAPFLGEPAYAINLILFNSFCGVRHALTPFQIELDLFDLYSFRYSFIYTLCLDIHNKSYVSKKGTTYHSEYGKSNKILMTPLVCSLHLWYADTKYIILDRLKKKND